MAQNGPRIIKLLYGLRLQRLCLQKFMELSPGEKLMHVYVIDLDKMK